MRSFPGAVRLDRLAFQVADFDVVEQRLARTGDVAAVERELCRLDRPLEARVNAKVEGQLCELVPELNRLVRGPPRVSGAATLGSPFTRLSRLSVDCACRRSTKAAALFGRA